MGSHSKEYLKKAAKRAVCVPKPLVPPQKVALGVNRIGMERTTEELKQNLGFAARLTRMPNGETRPLPARLEREREAVVAELARREIAAGLSGVVV
jgi:hypothetical protein